MDLFTEIRRAGIGLARLGQVTFLRLSGGLPPGKPPEGDGAAIRALAGRPAGSAGQGSLRARDLFELPADPPPWVDTRIDLAEGESLTWISRGRGYLSSLLDIF